MSMFQDDTVENGQSSTSGSNLCKGDVQKEETWILQRRIGSGANDACNCQECIKEYVNNPKVRPIMRYNFKWILGLKMKD